MKMTRKIAFHAAVALCAMLLQGCWVTTLVAPQAINHTPAAWVPTLPVEIFNDTRDPITRPIREGDPIVVRVRAGTIPVVDADDVVDSFGNITLELLGEFKVGQMTATEAEAAVRDAYVSNGYLMNPTVTVLLVRPPLPDEVYVTGEVLRKGCVIPYRDGLTMRQAIVAAGDVSPFASSEVTLTRKGKTERYNLNRIKNGTQRDPPLIAGDLIEVMRSMW